MSGPDVIEVVVPDWDGAEVHERLLADRLSVDTYRLRLSPGLVGGVASGDIVRYVQSTRTLEVVERAGNICVQVFHHGLPDNIVDHITDQVALAGGSVDGHDDKLLVLTFPVRAGFAEIEGFLQSLEALFDIEWMFGNVYASDGQPLNWWVGI